MPATSSAPGSYSQQAQARGAKKVAKRAVKPVAQATAQAVTAGVGTAASVPAVSRAAQLGYAHPDAPSPQAAEQAERRATRKARKARQTANTIERLRTHPEKASRQLTAKTAKLARKIESETGAHVARPKVKLGETNATGQKLTVTPKLAQAMLASEPIAQAKFTKKLAKASGTAPQTPSPKKARRQYATGRKTLPGLDAQQTRVAAKVLKQGVKAGASKKELLAAAETGLVESGFRNLDYGDADSEGWRQERTSIYGTGPKGPTNVKAAARRFFAESVSDTGGTRGKGESAGSLAQDIQGSAFPERYDEVRAQAKPIVKAFLSGKGAPGAPKKLAGPESGSREVVRKLVGSKVHGDHGTANEGTVHTPGGDHYDPNSYAQDINNPSGNPAEGEPPYNQATLNKIVRNARKFGFHDVPALKIGQNYEGAANGYRLQLLTNEGGTVNHIHVGVRWEGAGAVSAPTFTGYSTSTTTAAPVGTPSATTEAPASAPRSRAKRSGSRRRKQRARQMEGRQRSKFIRSLISNPPTQTPEVSLPEDSELDAYLNRKVSISV